MRKQQTKLKWSVYRTSFHGGGLISRHHTKDLAEKAARKYRSSDCVCGCAGVIGPGEEPLNAEYNRNILKNPYALTD